MQAMGQGHKAIIYIYVFDMCVTHPKRLSFQADQIGKKHRQTWKNTEGPVTIIRILHEDTMFRNFVPLKVSTYKT